MVISSPCLTSIRIGIFHQKSILRTPQQNSVVERRNQTLVEAALTMPIFSKASMNRAILLTPGQIRSGLVPNPVPTAPYVPPTNKELEILFQPMFDEYFETPSVEQLVPPAPAVQVLVISANTPSSAESSSGDVSAAESDQVIQPHEHLVKWSKDHPMENIIVKPKNFKSVVTKDYWFEAMQEEIHEFY
ncbi:retrovirus-related pol polyprotein from transposon TNT 1-94 [Tanacetum coccineum]